jgi:hypothetical protein
MMPTGSEMHQKTGGIKPCIPGRKSRGKPVKHDKRRTRIEIMFGRLKDWRRVATVVLQYGPVGPFPVTVRKEWIDAASTFNRMADQTVCRMDEA